MLVNFNNLPSMPGIPASASAGATGIEFPDLETSLRLSFEEADNAQQNSFTDILKDAIGAVDAQHRKSLDMALGFVAGQPYDIHQVTIEAAKAEAQIHLTSQVTSRVAQSYQTLMNMQI